MKKFKLHSFSRLTILFILAFLVPGIVLTYLSIQNIKNLEELTEKRILEEEKELVKQIRNNLDSTLLITTQNFDSLISDPNFNKKELLSFAESTNLVDNPFFLNHYFQFDWPRLTPATEFNMGFPNNRFKYLNEQAESEEFRRLNYKNAVNFYSQALKVASNKIDSARCINAMARTTVKASNHQQALIHYLNLITDFDTVIDVNGIPFIQYVIPQIILISDSSKSEVLIEKFTLILEKMKFGLIPLSYSTDVLLDKLWEWFDSIAYPDKEAIYKIKVLIDQVRNRFEFSRAYQPELSNYSIINSTKSPLDIVNDFNMFTGPPTRSQELIFIKESTNLVPYYGFTANLDTLLPIVINIPVHDQFKFDYQVSILNNDSLIEMTDSKLITIEVFNPITPKILVVKLKNDDALKSFLTRTKSYYVISIILMLGGMVLGIFLIISDINRERKLNDLRSEFVSNVTHELKTPLTSIYLFVESILLGRVKSEKDKKDYLKIILQETDRLKRLINNVLDFAKIEKGKLKYHFEETDISDIMFSAIKEIDYWIKESGFLLATDIEKEIFAIVDRDALKQAIINLLSNAIKYSNERKEIHARIRSIESQIHIVIEDKGMGIPEKYLDKVFEKYFRIDYKDKHTTSGTGLGLTMVKNIIDAHKGEIKVESKLGYGSKFTIILNFDLRKK